MSAQAILIYSISFFRERFLVSLGFAAIIFPVLALCYIMGAQVGGQVVDRFGRKPFTILTAVIASIFIIFFTNMPHFWLSMAFACLGCLFAAMLGTAVSSLALEQVPSFRGTMMSLSATAGNIGTALGAGVGGLALLWLDYEGVGLLLEAMTLITALIVYLLVIDPHE